MNRIVVCLDCPEYQKGGYCNFKRKSVGALDNACEHSQSLAEFPEPKAEEKVMEYKSAPETTKKCERCGEVLPLEQFEWYNYKGTNKRRRICSKCYHDAMKKNDKKAEGMKVCMRENLRKHVSKPKPKPEPERIVVREVMTDEQMVAELRANGWEVICRKTVHLEL